MRLSLCMLYPSSLSIFFLSVDGTRKNIIMKSPCRDLSGMLMQADDEDSNNLVIYIKYLNY